MFELWKLARVNSGRASPANDKWSPRPSSACPRPSSARRESIRPGIWLAVILLTVLGVYLTALPGEFVWDDRSLIRGVRELQATGSVWKAFLRPFWPSDELAVGVPAYYRPLSILSFALDCRIHGDNSAGFRLTNLAFHILNTALVFALANEFGSRNVSSAILASLWALQPRLAESAAWISGRTDVLAATFVLAAVWVWKPTATRRAFASLLVLGGLLCKEVALAGVCVVIVLEFTQHQVPRLSRAVRCIWPVTAVSAYIALRQAALGFQTPTSEGIALGQRPRLVLEALGRYALMTIDACRPRAQIGYVQDPAWGFVVLGICVAVALVVAAVVLLRRRDQRKLVAFTLLVTSIALACHIVPISLANVCCDRFLYLPTVGLVLLAATGTRATPKWVTILAFVVLACFVKVTARCAQRWADPIALWTETCTHPASRSGIALLELGNLEMNAGNYQRAMRIFSG